MQQSSLAGLVITSACQKMTKTEPLQRNQESDLKSGLTPVAIDLLVTLQIVV